MPRGRYSASPGSRTVSISGSSATRSAISDLKVVEGLISQRVGDDRRVDGPVLAPGHLQDEHVVNVVMRREALVLRRGDVRVDLDRMAELVGEPCGEVDERRPRSVQALEHQRRAIRERGQHLVVGRLVRDRGAGSSAPGERSRRSDRAVLRHAQERRPQPTLGHQLVDRGGVDQVGEARRELSRARQSRPATPVLLGELPRGTGDTARQRRVACQHVYGHV